MDIIHIGFSFFLCFLRTWRNINIPSRIIYIKAARSSLIFNIIVSKNPLWAKCRKVRTIRYRNGKVTF